MPKLPSKREGSTDKTHLNLVKLLQDELIRDAFQHLENRIFLLWHASLSNPQGVSKRSSFPQSDGVCQSTLSKSEGIPQGQSLVHLKAAAQWQVSFAHA